MKNESENIACKHFDECGGCSLQHLNEAEYYSKKEAVLLDIGLPKDCIKPITKIGWGSRRRAELKVAVNKGDIKLGFFAKKSHDVVNINECPVSEAKLVALLEPLRGCLGSLKKAGAVSAISLTSLDKGIDAVFITQSKLNDSDKEKITAFSKKNNIIRLTVDDKRLYGEANIIFDGVSVELPVGAFLQATQKGQDAITDFVVSKLEGCSHIADLYSGCGTYSFPLVKKAKNVAAFEGDEQMVSALYNAARGAGLDGRITATTRDLFSRPLKAHELSQFDGAVINPPRNGALPQVENIAASNIGKIVMVSCNPQTFRRDAKCLMDNGYKLKEAVSIDQFYMSDHLELVAFFEK